MYVEEDLVFYNEMLENQEQLFDFLADKLEKKDYVTKGFREAIKEREKEYPTGLKLNRLNISIAHTDPEFCKTEKLAVIKPENTISFKNIEDLKPLEVDLVFGLILQDSNKHLKILQKISQLLQDEQVIKAIEDITSQAELSSLMQQYFNDTKENE